MIHGIAVVGANGSGKTTLGKALAELTGYKHLDAEDYFFTESAVSYANPRTREEAMERLLTDVEKHGAFILSAVNGDFGEKINVLYDCVIYIQAPLEIRLQRVRERSFRKFGNRALAGGDLYKQEEDFLNFVAARTMEKTDRWLQSVKCPVIYIDGTEPIASNTERLWEMLFTP